VILWHQGSVLWRGKQLDTEAIAEVARRAGIPKREVYDAVVKSSAPRK